MDGQDERRGRIYNNKYLTKDGKKERKKKKERKTTAVLRTPKSSRREIPKN